jgi:hypothetical protein
MPSILRHNYGGGLERLSVCIRPETKRLLEEYSYRSRQTVSKGVDTLIEEGAARFFDGDGARERDASDSGVKGA